MAEDANPRAFDHCLGCLISSALDELAAHLAATDRLSDGERSAVEDAVREALFDTLHRKLTRLLVVELHIAREDGRLVGATPEERWDDFVAAAATPEFWRATFAEYPTLERRLNRVIGDQVAAARVFVADWLADRDDLSALLGEPAGALHRLRFAQGDRHAGGRTVAIVDTDGGRVVYKPRSLAVDGVLADFLARLDGVDHGGADHGGADHGRADNGDADHGLSLRVAPVLDRGDHGWAGFVPHRFADSDAELASFYRGIGEALAAMRMTGGSDLHGENLIAHAGSPVLIDCETLFTPNVTAFASPYGQAHDHAAALVGESVLAIGLLPDRAQGLGWRGIDMSGVGGLPDQQPETLVPGLVDAGTDRARIELVTARVPRAANHPAETPRLFDFWPEVLAGYDDLTARLRTMDAAGRLAPALAPFADCPTRAVVRPTETYAELSRMLWHPASLVDEPAAVERARDVLAAMADNFAFAPSDPVVIAAEVEDLLGSDVPIFTTTPARGQLDGPGGTTWLPPTDRIAATLSDWRRADDDAERDYIRAALVSAYVNDGFNGDGMPRRVAAPDRDDLDKRRRAQAARLMECLLRTAHRGDDGSVSWVAPILAPSGWTVQPLGPDLYTGLSGLALTAGAYAREAAAGRADVVDGVDDLYARLLATLRRWEAEQRRERIEHVDVRPPSVGGYVGLGSQIWTRLALYRIGMDDDRAIADALAITEGLPWAEGGDDRNDLLYGRAGAIPPLVQLAAISGDDAPLAIARRFGEGIAAAATHDDAGRAWWQEPRLPRGLGGFAHGASGIGWAMGRLAAATGDDAFARTSAGAFAFEDSLWDPQAANWRDLRGLEGVVAATAWCHGTVGIALARLDLDPDLAKSGTAQTLDRAVRGTLAGGSGWNHCLCHGDFGAWELYDRAIRLGRAPDLDPDTLLAELVTGLEEHGPLCGVTRDSLTPGLFTGVSGVIYQLLRTHPHARLPSPLLLA